MADPSLFDAIRIPAQTLIELDDRSVHFALQPYHHLVRLVHVLTMAAFFGGIGLLDLRLMGWRGTIPLRAYAEHVLPWLFVTFAVAMATGTVLFIYDPVHVGSHAYFAPKLVLIALGLLNALLFHRTSTLKAVAAEHHTPLVARVAGAVSLAMWTGVVVCASLNVEGVPKVLLR